MGFKEESEQRSRKGRELRKRVVIVGAGVAGLTLAERLTASERDVEVTVLEMESDPGGLARTFQREGFFFDIGPHRFHTSDPDVSDYILRILDDDHVTINRRSNVYMVDKYRNWPLTMRSIAGLPFPVLFRSFLDIFRRNPTAEPASFADHVISKYGQNIYDFFFSDYTEKFTGHSAEELHVDWAEAGVNRAVIDKHIKADNLLALLGCLLLPRPVATKFYYPSTGGIQTFCDVQADLVRERGGSIIFDCRAVELKKKLGRVTGVKTDCMGTFDADRVFWSAPISLLYPDAGFDFMDSLVCNIALSAPQDNEYQWCYFGQKDILFSRLTVPRNFRSDTVPEGCDSIIAEITVTDDSMRNDPGSLRERILQDLVRVDAIDPDDIIFMDWKVIPNTYPIYDLDYRRRLDSISIPSGLQLLGRCGSFWYNNMDHSIGQSLAMAEGEDYSKDFWKAGNR